LLDADGSAVKRIFGRSWFVALGWWWPVFGVLTVALSGWAFDWKVALTSAVLILALAGCVIAQHTQLAAVTLITFVAAAGAFGTFVARTGHSSSKRTYAPDAQSTGGKGRDRAASRMPTGWLDLSGASLVGAQLAGARLERADLSGAVLRRACLRGTNLAGAQLAGADFTGSDHRGVRGRFDTSRAIGWNTSPSASACR
jgi:hypothetical protein